MSTHLSIRLDPEVKHYLEKLAEKLNVTISDLIRNTIVKVLNLLARLDELETIKQLEKKLVRAIMVTEEFQELLRKLPIREEHRYVGYKSERLEHIPNVVAYADNFVVRIDSQERLILKKLVPHERCNEYGKCWTEDYYAEDIETLDELITFLDKVEKNVDKELRAHIERIRRILF